MNDEPQIDYTDDCNNCLCSVPRASIGELRNHSKPFYCNHPSLPGDDVRKVNNADAFNARPSWCPLEEKEVLIRLRSQPNWKAAAEAWETHHDHPVPGRNQLKDARRLSTIARAMEAEAKERQKCDT